MIIVEIIESENYFNIQYTGVWSDVKHYVVFFLKYINFSNDVNESNVMFQLTRFRKL